MGLEMKTKSRYIYTNWYPKHVHTKNAINILIKISINILIQFKKKQSGTRTYVNL